mmetsp:Transcript_8968/g.11258  ORF Transcript_8968/g.11258 Transcript_8968/m.11258 type:complete len:91 (-) Transcript_8968:710-982(-)|eukprot:CAMPEP_0204822896 /NCGR_PEP_ID=MMETSP1346-20131115/1084_1 /ASSEMBLY_ACC=CAM_ASM_000771 /TAXON_ID=215587 /ORGANISM="Aplanochytrium stocchinoi, Strain GSBS06" /LENGTH=90 /DNA_ID=CAMNT_0051949363 /DNA_START=147 /DNA_END=419 /DNA_ORIENTATION=-
MSADAAAEAKKISNNHKKWIVDLLRESNNEVTCEKMFEEGEKHHCDSLGALLRSLKNSKVIDFPGIFLFARAEDNDKIIKLINEDYDPFA